MIYIVHCDADYHKFILEPLKERKDIELIEIPINLDWIGKLFFRIDSMLKLNLYPYIRYIKSDIFKLRFAQKDDTIILFSIISPMDVLWIHRMTKKHDLHVWTWNPIPKTFFNYINKASKKGIKFYTFDESDAKLHSIKLLPQVYRQVDMAYEDIRYDFTFIGRDKGRIDTIVYITSLLEKLGYYGNVLIIGSPHMQKSLLKSIIFSSSTIPYKKVLEYEKSSKIIIDITQEGQNGLTLRILEALFFKKKVISNNKTLRNYEWYNTDNFFILGHDNIDSLSDFLKKEYSAVDSNILRKYEINNWIDNFID